MSISDRPEPVNTNKRMDKTKNYAAGCGNQRTVTTTLAVSLQGVYLVPLIPVSLGEVSSSQLLITNRSH